MEDAIKNFAKQFSFTPRIYNESRYEKKDRFIVAGMGGSHLAGGLLKRLTPAREIIIHQNYGLPPLSPEVFGRYTFIASSYSGNTEEIIDGLGKALEKQMNIIVLATGGRLLETARERGLPYIEIPATGIQPRSALGFSLMALLAATRDEKTAALARKLSEEVGAEQYENEGRELARWLTDHVPIIYSSAENYPVAYNWKIKCNETGKIPAFCNVFPELNHNEMTGFDSVKKLTNPFAFLLITDNTDHPRIQKRMEIFSDMFQGRGFPVRKIPFRGDTLLNKIFSSLLTADWMAYHTARMYGLEPEHVPLIEDFKKKM